MTKLLQSWNEILEGERKTAHNSAIKIEATKGRELYKSKSGKTAAAHIPTRLGSISIDGNRWGVYPSML